MRRRTKTPICSWLSYAVFVSSAWKNANQRVLFLRQTLPPNVKLKRKKKATSRTGLPEPRSKPATQTSHFLCTDRCRAHPKLENASRSNELVASLPHRQTSHFCSSEGCRSRPNLENASRSDELVASLPQRQTSHFCSSEGFRPRPNLENAPRSNELVASLPQRQTSHFGLVKSAGLTQTWKIQNLFAS